MEVAAGWIVAALMAVGLILQWRAKERPRHLVCHEFDRSALISINPHAKSRVTTLFDGAPVDNLSQTQFHIANDSDQVIRDISLVFKFPDDTKILDASYDIQPQTFPLLPQTPQTNQTQVSIPFINPYRHHSHVVHASFVCVGDVQGVKVIGGGEGWSVRQINPLTQAEARHKLRIGLAVYAGLVLLGVAYVIVAGTLMGIGEWEISLRSFLLLGLPILAVSAAAGIFITTYAFVPIRRRPTLSTAKRPTTDPPPGH